VLLGNEGFDEYREVVIEYENEASEFWKRCVHLRVTLEGKRRENQRSLKHKQIHWW